MSSNVAFTIEPYRKGAKFNDWFTRLKYLFGLNKVKDEDKMAYLITLGGPVIFEEIKLLYPAGDFEKIAFEDLIAKLKNRLDKTDPDLVQRYKFSTRVQHPDETTEDFILALKLQAEFCDFENFKEKAILDRLIAGIIDKNLRQRLLSEEKLTLAAAEKIIATWEVAKANAYTTEKNGENPNMVAAVANQPRHSGKAMKKLADVFKVASKYQTNDFNAGAGSSRGPVKSRLGFRDLTSRQHLQVEEIVSDGDRGETTMAENVIKPMNRDIVRTTLRCTVIIAE